MACSQCLDKDQEIEELKVKVRAMNIVNNPYFRKVKSELCSDSVQLAREVIRLEREWDYFRSCALSGRKLSLVEVH